MKRLETSVHLLANQNAQYSSFATRMILTSDSKAITGRIVIGLKSSRYLDATRKSKKARKG